MKAPGYPTRGSLALGPRSVLRCRRAARCAARRLAASGATGRLAAARGSGAAARAARSLPAGGGRVGSGRGAAAAARDGGSHQHSRNGRHCQGLRKIHFRSPRAPPRGAYWLFPASPRRDSVKRTRERYPGIVWRRHIFAWPPPALSPGPGGTVTPDTGRMGTKAMRRTLGAMACDGRSASGQTQAGGPTGATAARAYKRRMGTPAWRHPFAVPWSPSRGLGLDR
jgi:hypothetical protein